MLDATPDSGANGPLPRAFQAVRRHYRYVFLYSALVSILYLSSSIYMMLVYDKVLSSGSAITLASITLALVVALATLAFLDSLRSNLLLRAGMRLDRLLSGRTMDAMLEGASYGNVRSGRGLRDLDQVRAVITGQPVLALFDAPWAVIFLIVLFMLHWSLAALALLGGGLFLLIAIRAERRVREPTSRANEAVAAVNASIEATLHYAGPVRALGISPAVINLWQRRREQSRTLNAHAGNAGLTSTAVLKFLRLLWQSLALALGALLAIEGAIAPGAMIAASILMGRVLGPMEQIVGAWRPLVSTQDAYARLKAALWTDAEEASKRMQLPPFAGRVDVENLVVRTETGPPILAGVSFSVSAGETLGVIGPAGAGKSTLLKALFGLVPASGLVRFDAAEISQWRPQDLYSRIGYLPQEVALLPGTVRDNISRFETQTPAPPSDIDAAVYEACKDASIHEEILKLPLGYDTLIEAGGTALSGGQRQRLALARAIYRTPSLVVMDEPNAHLDSVGEAALAAVLRRLRDRGCTVIVVTHRSNLLFTAHKVLSLVAGRVQMFGSRDEVMSSLANARPALTSVPGGGGGVT
ncbi:MAG: type I secretion system permease/ATPase [Hyphomonadaceae bacterium]